jgi:pyrroloquinoline quinone (PQQ) biosynthesis protein C
VTGLASAGSTEVEHPLPPHVLADSTSNVEARSLETYVACLLYGEAPVPAMGTPQSARLCHEIDALAEASRAGAPETSRLLHSILYRINTAHLALPWRSPTVSVHHPLFAWIRDRLESAWWEEERRRSEAILETAPSVTDAFRDFAFSYVERHRSSSLHPLFPFLRDEATFEQLRQFHYQETPLDICFADILCLMMVGLPATIRHELAENYWDEMGRGDPARNHRSLRLRMMQAFGLSDQAHLDAVETFVWEELALANLYFRGALDRRALVEAIGVMLATEIAVPARIECQLEGCRRVGLPEEALDYLAEHVTVDIGHAQGWMDEVVLPMLRERPALAPDLFLGVVTRLELAASVCDRMERQLREISA